LPDACRPDSRQGSSADAVVAPMNAVAASAESGKAEHLDRFQWISLRIAVRGIAIEVDYG
jgi:hypothetical protein